MRRVILIFAFTFTLLGTESRPALALPPFWKAFAEKYVKVGSSNSTEAAFATAAKDAKCNVCHVKGQDKKVRNAYGAQLDLLLDKANYKSARLKAEPDKVKAELEAALDKVAAIASDPKNPASPTFAARIAQGELPSDGTPVQLAQAEPTKVEPPKTEPAKTEVKTEPPKTEPPKTEEKKAEPAKTEPKQPEPPKTEEKKAEPPKTETAKTEPAKPQPPKTEEKKTEPAKTETQVAKVDVPAAQPPAPPAPEPPKVVLPFPKPVDAATEQAAIAAITSVGGTVREVAQNDDSKEIDFHLGGTALTDAGLAHVKSVNKAVSLNLKDTQITDAGLASLSGMTGLRRLHLEKTHITDAALVHLKDLGNLEYVNLYGTAVTDAGLDQLKGLKNLRHLYVWQTKVTDEGAKKLKEALPGIEVVK